MAVLKRKSRMISLRLTEEEYETLRNLYRAHGSRSISDFARTAMERVIQESAATPNNSVEMRLHDLDAKMAALDQDVARLVNLLEDRLPSVSRVTSSAA